MFRTIFLLSMTASVFSQSDLDKAVALYKAKNYADARLSFNNFLTAGIHAAESNFYLGLIANFKDRDYESAIDYFDKATELDGSRHDYFYWLGNAYGQQARKSNFVKQAIYAPKMKNAWEKALELNPAHLESMNSLIIFYIQAPGIMGGSVDKAREMAERITSLDAFSGAMANFNIADYEKDDARIEISLKKAIQINPQVANPHLRLGYFYMNKGRHDEAITVMKKLAEVAPNDANSYDSLGDAYFKKGLIDDAITSYEKAVQLDSRFIASVFNLGECYSKKGMAGKAKPFYEMCITIDPKSSFSDKAKTALDK